MIFTSSISYTGF